MTTTPHEPSPDPEVVPSSDPATIPDPDPASDPSPHDDPGVPVPDPDRAPI